MNALRVACTVAALASQHHAAHAMHTPTRRGDDAAAPPTYKEVWGASQFESLVVQSMGGYQWGSNTFGEVWHRTVRCKGEGCVNYKRLRFEPFRPVLFYL